MTRISSPQFNSKARARMHRQMVWKRLDYITRGDDPRSGENAGGESLVLCDGPSR
jgi:hypothetical protein